MASEPKRPAVAKVSDVIATFQPTRKFGPRSGEKPCSITSIDFDDTGELCLVARDDETLQIYNCKEGKHAKEAKSQKYGVDLARFAHHPQSIIYASTKGDDAIRYLSSHDNSYIRYFRGHTAPVTCIALNPSCDEFISSSLDNTVRHWDMRSQHPQGQLNLTGPLLCAYDPTASVLAVACPPAQSVLLYDARNYERSPFVTFDLQPVEERFVTSTSGRQGSGGHTPGDWTKIEFSNDGKTILIGTTGPGHYLLDAYEGELKAYCARPQGPTNRIGPAELGELRSKQQSGRVKPGAPGVSLYSQGDVCLSPDGRYVIGGSGETGLYAWDSQAGEFSKGGEKILRPTYELGNKIAGTASVVAYNPRHNLLCTADKSLVFWLPEVDF